MTKIRSLLAVASLCFAQQAIAEVQSTETSAAATDVDWVAVRDETGKNTASITASFCSLGGEARFTGEVFFTASKEKLDASLSDDPDRHFEQIEEALQTTKHAFELAGITVTFDELNQETMSRVHWERAANILQKEQGEIDMNADDTLVIFPYFHLKQINKNPFTNDCPIPRSEMA